MRLEARIPDIFAPAHDRSGIRKSFQFPPQLECSFHANREPVRLPALTEESFRI
jgi:hypothetical protein